MQKGTIAMISTYMDDGLKKSLLQKEANSAVQKTVRMRITTTPLQIIN